MTISSRPENRCENRPHGRRRRWSSRVRSSAAMATLLGLAVFAAGCGDAPGRGGPGPMAQFVDYATCMRSHGIQDFPDPVTSPGGGVAFQIDGGPGSDLNRNNPTFKAAEQACQSLLPGAGRVPGPVSPQKLAAEVSWARCMRSHGLPNFPDPDAQGVFDSAGFDENSPAFQTASNACRSLQPAGPTPVGPGRDDVGAP
jgi:hypothetical protein